MSNLAECPGCQRHVRVTESKCPFCGIEATLSAPTFTTSAVRLSRAALLVALTACENGTSSRDVYGGPPHAAVYGGPPVSGDASSALEEYLRDAGIDGSVIDASTKDALTKDAAAPPPTIERTIYGGPPVTKPEPPKK